MEYLKDALPYLLKRLNFQNSISRSEMNDFLKVIEVSSILYKGRSLIKHSNNKISINRKYRI